MTRTTSTLSLDPHGNGFLLARVDENGRRSEMILSDMDVLKIAQSAQRLEDTIRAKLGRPGVMAAAHMPVAQVSLNTDLHLNEILLGMIGGNGAVERFALPLEVARPFSERLSARVAQIEAAIPTRTKQ